MTKDLIKIIEKNIQYLKNSLDLTEAHITWGSKSIKEKYSKIKETLLNKLQEQRIDLIECTESSVYDEEYNTLLSELQNYSYN
jgi:hypothetical protein